MQSADSSRSETASRTHIKQTHEIGGMHEQMSRKREREAALMQSLPGSNRKLRIQHYSKAQIPTNYLSETGGIEGLLIFNEGQNTYQNPHTDFMRILLQACNIPNVWNYTRKQVGAETLNIPVWHAGQVTPIHGSHTVQSITNRMKFVAEDKTKFGWLSEEKIAGGGALFVLAGSVWTRLLRGAGAHPCTHTWFGASVPALVLYSCRVQKEALRTRSVAARAHRLARGSCPARACL